MSKKLGSNFLLCGLSGWCLECLWTGLDSLFHQKAKGKELFCRTSLWMFPIYGMAAFFSPLCNRVKDKSTPIRGFIYTICIFTTEFATGSFLKKYQACPWDYSKSRFNIKGVIRLDYFPAWFAAGLFFERLIGFKKNR